MKKHTMNITITAVDHGSHFELDFENKIEANGEALTHMTAAVLTRACLIVADATKKKHGVEQVPSMVKAFVAEVTGMGAKHFLDKFTDNLSEDERLAMMVGSLRGPNGLNTLIELLRATEGETHGKGNKPQSECNCPICQELRKKRQ